MPSINYSIYDYTMTDMLTRLRDEDQRGITFINGADKESFMAYETLCEEALKCLYLLQEVHGMKKGEELIFQVEDNKEFLILFWACLFGGIIAVPLSIGNQDSHRKKLLEVWNNLAKPKLVIDERNLERIEKYANNENKHDWLEDIQRNSFLISSVMNGDKLGTIVDSSAEDLAYIQFSSGSTGSPKGVMLTHRNLVYNTHDIASRYELTQNDAALSWMPLTHDMGIIGFHLTSLVYNINHYVMPTSLFIRRPLLWFDKVSEHKIAQVYSPNFGYEYLLNALDHKTPEWNLSSVRVIYNGAEPISYKLCNKFLERMASFKLKASAMFTVYGLAEASVAVCLPTIGSGIRTHFLDRGSLEIGNKVVNVEPTDKLAVDFVEVGEVIEHCNIRICDDKDQLLEDGRIGNIQISGLNVTDGYYRKAEATANLKTKDGWVKTGDLGFMLNGKLIITGRKKNIIIINGQNYYPQDIERALNDIKGLETGKVVAIGTNMKVQDKEELLLFVLFKKKPDAFLPVINTIKRRLAETIGLIPDKIIPVRRILKTTSGKVQNFAFLDAYVKGDYDEVIAAIEELSSNTICDDINETQFETKIKEIVFDIAGKKIEKEDSFIGSGISSLQLVRIINRLKEELGVNVAIDELFRINNFDSFLQFAFEKRGRKEEIIETKKWSEEEPFALSHAQKRIWISSQVSDKSRSLNLSTTTKVKGNLQPALLREALTEVVQNHASLRTVFGVQNNEPFQKVLKVENIGEILTYVENINDNELNDCLAKYANRVFDLEKGPLFRFLLINVSDQEFVFQLTVHHIVVDGWSSGILFRDIDAAYRALTFGEQQSLITNASYRDFVVWEKTMLAKEPSKLARAFYKKEFEQPLTNLNFSESKATNHIDLEGEMLTFTLPNTLREKIKTISTRDGATPFITLLTILNVLIYKYTGKTDILLGTESAGRSHKQFENIIGYFLNTLMVRTVFEETNTWEQVTSLVKEKLFNAFRHQSYPIDLAIQDENVISQLEGRDLFDVLVLYQNFEHALKMNQFASFELEEIPQPIKNCYVNIQFEFVEHSNLLELNVKYKKSMFSADFIKGMYERMLMLIDQVSTKSATTVDMLSIISDEEKERILNVFNSNTIARGNTSVINTFETQVAASPDKVALVCGNTELTYRELNERSNQLAHYLRDSVDLQIGDKVGLFLEKNEWMIISILAVLKNGATYIPIDVEYPTNRVQYIMDDCDMDCILSSKHTSDFRDVNIIEINDLAVTLSALSTSNPNQSIDQDSLAYILYTSGTTGKPKGVMIALNALTDYVETFKDYFNINSTDVVLQQSSISFDTHVEEVFPVLLSGGQLIVLTDNNRNIDTLRTVVEEKEITVLSSTPLVINELNKTPEVLASLRCLISGGDVLKANHISNILGRFPLYNTYGPTESTVCCTYQEVKTVKDIYSIGKPIANRQVLILDEKQALVPIGSVGEIYIGGAGLAKGYINNEEETASKFINISLDDTARVYRTGDLGKWNTDGTIEFIGRSDYQLKIRGYRIELGEIENIFSTCFSVEDVVVKAFGEGDDKYLAAFYVSNETLPTVQNIRKQLFGKLPTYMIPSEFIELEEFPKNTNAKIDRKRLVLPTNVKKESSNLSVPITTAEISMAGVWQEVLQVNSIGVNENFFQKGGHSINGTILISKINHLFNCNLSLKDLFLNPTISELLSEVEHTENNERDNIQLLPVQEKYEISHAQKRLFFLSSLEQEISSYNIPVVYNLNGPLDIDILERAFRDLIGRHESLRTYFVSGADRIFQRIEKSEDVSFNLKVLPCNAKWTETELDNKIRSVVNKKFNLRFAPLFRTALFKKDESNFIFCFVISHLVADGWSVKVLFKELFETYNAYANNTTVNLSELKIQYKDYASFQNQKLIDGGFQQQKSYWLNQFENEIPKLELTTDTKEIEHYPYKGLTKKFVFSKEETAVLTQTAQATEKTLFMILLTSVYTLLYRYTNQEKIVIGTPVAGRNHKDLEDQIGFYVNTLPLLIELQGQDNLMAVLEKVKKCCLDAFDNQDFPFDLLVDDLKLERDLSKNPLFNVLVAMQESELYNEQQYFFEGLQHSAYDFDKQICSFDLSIEFVNKNDQVETKILFNNDRFDEVWADQFMVHYQNIARSIINYFTELNEQKEVDIAISELPLLTNTDRKKLLVDFNNTDFPIDENKTVLSLFEEQVLLHPDKVAIDFYGKQLTYKALHEKSNQLAHYLKAEGLKPNQFVPLYLNRSLEMVIGILAVLKAGGVYVSVDPEYPKERIDYILADINASLLLTQESLLENIPDVVCRKIVLDEEATLATTYPVSNVVETPALDDLAYIIYTSGSTGKPKGVMITHRNASCLIHWSKDVYSSKDMEGMLASTSFNFDLSIFELFAPLATGGTVYLVENLLSLLTMPKLPISFINTVPSLMEELLKSGTIPNGVRIVNLAGEPLSTDLVNRIYEIKHVDSVFDLYGPSEATTYITYCRRQYRQKATIGKPLYNSQIYILGSNMELLAPGKVGELCIGGDQVAKGYLNRPELTDEKFVSDQFTTKPNQKLYKTGDLAKWLPDGNLEYIGRKDEQVKIRGHRIELGEIESALRGHQAIENAVVVAKDLKHGKELVAYFVPTADYDLSEMKTYLRKKLPVYMVPAVFQKLESIPLTPNGKINRKALPDPQLIERKEAYVAPRTPLEKELVQIWEELLDQDNIGIYDNFFELRGNSIKSIILSSKLSAMLQKEVNPKVVFINQTIASVAAYIQNSLDTEDTRMEVVEAQDHYPVTGAQKGLWLLHQQEANAAYNMPSVYSITGALDLVRLETSFNALVKRHEILRSKFFLLKGELRYQIVENAEVKVDCIFAEKASNEELDQLISKEASDVFDLENDSLIKVKVINIEPGRNILICMLHHIISDGWSSNIIVSEIMELYNKGEAHTMQPLEYQYKDFAIHQQQWLKSDAVHVHENYWKQIFKEGVPATVLPFDYSKDTTSQSNRSVLTFDLDTANLSQIEAIAQRENVTTNSILLSCVNLCLHSYLEKEKVVVGIPLLGRNNQTLYSQVGLYVNTLPFVYEISPDETFAEMCSSTHNEMSELLIHQMYPLEEVVKHCVSNAEANNSLFNILYVFEELGSETQLHFDGLDLEERNYENRDIKYDLAFKFKKQEKEGLKIQVSLEFNKNRYSDLSMELLADRLQQIISKILSEPEKNMNSVLKNIANQMQVETFSLNIDLEI